MLFLVLLASNILFAAADDDQKITEELRAAKVEIGAILNLIQVSSEPRSLDRSLDRLEKLLDDFPSESEFCQELMGSICDCRTKGDELTILHLVVNKSYGLGSLINRLSGSDLLSVQDNKGSTPLFYATNLKVIEALLKKGVCPHIFNKDGVTALGRYIGWSQKEIKRSNEYNLRSVRQRQAKAMALFIDYQQKKICGCFSSEKDTEIFESAAPEKEAAEPVVSSKRSKVLSKHSKRGRSTFKPKRR